MSALKEFLGAAGELSISAAVFSLPNNFDTSFGFTDGDRDLIRVGFTYESLGSNGVTSGAGISVDFSIHTVYLSLDQNQYILGVSGSESLESVLGLERDDNGVLLGTIAEIDGTLPNIVFETTVYIQLDAHKTDGVELNQSPIKDLLDQFNIDVEGTLSEILGSLLLHISDNQAITFALDIGADIELGTGEDNDYLTHIKKESTIRIQVRVWHTVGSSVEEQNKVWATITYENGNLYVDATPLNGDPSKGAPPLKVVIRDAYKMVFPDNEESDNAWLAIVEDVKNAASSARVGIEASLFWKKNGLYFVAEKSAIAALLNIFGLGGFDIFSNIGVVINVLHVFIIFQCINKFQEFFGGI